MKNVKNRAITEDYSPFKSLSMVSNRLQASRLPTTVKAINQYVADLVLKPSQQAACDMATD